MVNSERQFLEELQLRLAENRQLAERTLLPKSLSGLASYLAFHTFRTLLFLSLLMAVGCFWVFYPQLIFISKILFRYE